MRNVAVIVLGSMLLPGCAMLPSRVQPLEVAVAPPSNPNAPSNSLEGQVVANLAFAAGRRSQYIAEYTNLSNEQRLRDASILAASVGLSSETVFRGDANTLKFAGFFVGLTNFYDKAVPLSGRIAAAQSGYTNFNTLIQVGNTVLVNDLDADKSSLQTANVDLSSAIDYANQLIKNVKPATATACAPAVTAQACIQSQLDAQQTRVAAITKLQVSVSTATTTLAAGKAAYQALVNIPADVTATADTIDNVAWAGIAFTVDQTTLTQGFSAASAKPAAVPAKPQGVAQLLGAPPDPNKDLSDANDDVVLKTAAIQAILNRVDYAGLDSRIKAAAPPTPGSAAGSATTTSPAKTPPST